MLIRETFLCNLFCSFQMLHTEAKLSFYKTCEIQRRFQRLLLIKCFDLTDLIALTNNGLKLIISVLFIDLLHMFCWSHNKFEELLLTSLYHWNTIWMILRTFSTQSCPGGKKVYVCLFVRLNLNSIILEIIHNHKLQCQTRRGLCLSCLHSPGHSMTNIIRVWRSWPFAGCTCPSCIIDDLQFSALPHPVRLNPSHGTV